MSIDEDLEILASRQFNPTKAHAEVLRKISGLVEHCNQLYADQAFYGNAALNRKILLDPFVANTLTCDVIQYLMGTAGIEQQIERRALSGKVISIQLKEVIQYGFQDGLLAIKYLPNNDRCYGIDAYERQKLDFESNTMRIVRAIQMAVDGTTSYVIPRLPRVNQTQLLLISRLIDFFKNNHRSDELLNVVGYTAEDIREQVNHGFNVLLETLLIPQCDGIIQSTSDEIAEKFISHEKSLLHGMISHLFFDRLHLTAALESDKTLMFMDGSRCTYRHLFEIMVQKIEDFPGQYKLAAEQLSLRFQLIENTIGRLYPEEIKLQKISGLTSSTLSSSNYDDNGHYLVTEGPLPKSIFTVQLEKVTLRVVESLRDQMPIDVKVVGKDVYLYFPQIRELHNLSDLLQNANFEHVYLGTTFQQAYINLCLGPNASNELMSKRDALEANSQLQTQSLASRPFCDRLSRMEALAVSAYTASKDEGDHRFSTYLNVNQLLRNPAELQPARIPRSLIHVMILASAIARLSKQFTSIRPQKAERYFNDYGLDFELLSKKKGIVSLQGFVSTTMNMSPLTRPEEKFYLAKTMTYRMTFESTNGAAISAFSYVSREQELLMPPTQIQVLRYEPAKSPSDLNNITVRVVSDVASYSVRSMRRYTEPKDLCSLNYAPLIKIFEKIDSPDLHLRNNAIALVQIYQSLIEEGKLDSSNLDAFLRVKLSCLQYETGWKTFTAFNYEIRDQIQRILSMQHLQLVLKSYMKNPEVLRYLQISVFEELKKRSLISRAHFYLLQNTPKFDTSFPALTLVSSKELEPPAMKAGDAMTKADFPAVSVINHANVFEELSSTPLLNAQDKSAANESFLNAIRLNQFNIAVDLLNHCSEKKRPTSKIISMVFEQAITKGNIPVIELVFKNLEQTEENKVLFFTLLRMGLWREQVNMAYLVSVIQWIKDSPFLNDQTLLQKEFLYALSCRCQLRSTCELYSKLMTEATIQEILENMIKLPGNDSTTCITFLEIILKNEIVAPESQTVKRAFLLCVSQARFTILNWFFGEGVYLNHPQSIIPSVVERFNLEIFSEAMDIAASFQHEPKPDLFELLCSVHPNGVSLLSAQSALDKIKLAKRSIFSSVQVNRWYCPKQLIIQFDECIQILNSYINEYNEQPLLDMKISSRPALVGYLHGEWGPF